MYPLERLPLPSTSDRVIFLGNSGEGKSHLARGLLERMPNVIILNTKHDPFFESIVHGVVYRDDAIVDVGPGRYDYRPSDPFYRGHPRYNPAIAENFFKRMLDRGNVIVYVDELVDICPSAQRYPFGLQKIVKQGRWRHVGLWGSTQEPIRVPSFCLSQAQHRYLFYLGWPAHRKLAGSWFERDIPWSDIPERSHRFLLKTPKGVFGPQPPIR